MSQFDHLRDAAMKGEAMWRDLKEVEYEDRLQAETKMVVNAKRKEATKQRWVCENTRSLGV